MYRMIKDFLKYYLDISNQESKLSDIEERLGTLEEKVDGQEDLGQEVEELKQSFYDSRPVTSDLSKRERELLEVLIRSDSWKDKSDLAKEMDISKNYAGTLLSEVQKNIDIQSKNIGSNNKKAYKLSEGARSRIEQGI